MEKSLKKSENEISCENIKEPAGEKSLPAGFPVAKFAADIDADEISPVALAYLGDSVYEVLIRLYMLSHGSRQADKLHKHTTGFVNAASQAKMFYAIEEKLSEDELSVYKRGRNAKKLSSARNQSIGDYRKATGFEAVIGWLYLKKEYERIEELVLYGIAQMTDNR